MKIPLILANLVALMAVVVIMGFTLQAPTQAEDAPAARIVTVEAGTVASAVNATGTLEPRSQVSVGFHVSGIIQDVLVEKGRRVRAGEALARLDTGDLQLEAQKAQVDLQKAQTALAKLQAPANADDANSARAALAKAQAAYARLVAPPTEDETNVAAADLRAAEVALQKAQADYDKVSWSPGVGASPEAMALQDATITYEKAKSNYNIASNKATDDQVKAAQADIAAARATLNNLLRGAAPEDIAAAQSDVQAARLNLETAQRNLQRAVLVAPFDGIVTDVLLDPAQAAAAEAPVVTLADVSALQVNVPVDEIDLPQVQEGQTVTVTLDALANQPLGGRVTAIAPAPITSTDGTTTFQVTVSLPHPDPRARMGMTSKVAIQTQERQGVPVIPPGVIQIDGSGQTFVDRIGPDGQPVRTPVVLGLRSGASIEVVSGLQVGDRVAEPTSADRAQVTGAQGSGRPGFIPFVGGPPGGFRPGGGAGGNNRGGAGR